MPPSPSPQGTEQKHSSRLKKDEMAASLACAHSALIRYPRFKELHEEIQLCQELSHIAGEPQNISLEGDTGTGKTTLIKAYAQQYPRQETPQGTMIPVLYVGLPSPATVKSVAATILRELGDPAAHTGTLWSMNERAIHFLKTCGVQLVILDDFQHLYDSETHRILEKVSDWLKTLIKETGVPFLIVGIASKVEIILDANSQLSRLFAARERLLPLVWDAANPSSEQEFARFVDYAEKAIGIPLSGEISRLDILSRLHYASGGGVIGNLMNLLRYAAQLAAKHQQKTLNLQLLSVAFAKRIQKHVATLGYDLNPFDTPPEAPFASLPSQPQLTRLGGKAKRRRVPSPPKMREVLTTC